MPLAAEVQIGYFKYKGHIRGHNVINPGVIERGFISLVEYACQIWSLYQFWPRLNFFLPQTDKHTEIQDKK